MQRSRHRRPFQQPKKDFKKDFKKNHEIKTPQVRLIDENGQQIGVISTSEAIARALNVGLDLVEVSPQADPPVARILDYGKMIYEREKQERKNRARSKKSGEIKGIRLSVNIGDHDMMVRVNSGKKFLENGDKLKLELILRGREKAHPELVEKIIERYINMLKKPVTVEQPLNRLGGRFTTIIAQGKNS